MTCLQPFNNGPSTINNHTQDDLPLHTVPLSCCFPFDFPGKCVNFACNEWSVCELLLFFWLVYPANSSRVLMLN